MVPCPPHYCPTPHLYLPPPRGRSFFVATADNFFCLHHKQIFLEPPTVPPPYCTSPPGFWTKRGCGVGGHGMSTPHLWSFGGSKRVKVGENMKKIINYAPPFVTQPSIFQTPKGSCKGEGHPPPLLRSSSGPEWAKSADYGGPLGGGLFPM